MIESDFEKNLETRFDSSSSLRVQVSATVNMIKTIAALITLVGLSTAHGDHSQSPIVAGPHQGLWYNTLPGDGGTQVSVDIVGAFTPMP